MAWYVYILRCGDDSLYTGCTDNVPRRLAALKGKQRRFDMTAEKQDMDNVVLDFLK